MLEQNRKFVLSIGMVNSMLPRLRSDNEEKQSHLFETDVFAASLA
jgi:hypothetical protein